MATKKPAERKPTKFSEVGVTGLMQYSGYVTEERLRQLEGDRAVKVYREMADNDDTIGAILFAIEGLLRRVDWRVEAATDSPDDRDLADFVESCMMDMSHSWEEFISEVLSMLVFGWASHEIVYKVRVGPNESDPRRRSRFTDGLIGWRKLPIRSQDSLDHWEFDEDGGIRGWWQMPPTSGESIWLPIEKLLHFRTTSRKNNPEGRALDPSTEIPTPDGWKVLDDIRPGDKVFDEKGCIRYVTARADWEQRPCYKLTFNNGEHIIADENHQWLTQLVSERATRKPGKIRSTKDIAGSVKNTNGISQHGIPWSGRLDYPSQGLPLPPYILGLWLGDGHSRAAMITCHEDDVEETAAWIESAGYPVSVINNGTRESKGRLIRFYGTSKWASDGPSAALRILNLFQNKHIPDCYLRGSVQQRLELLSGLMDSDGYVNASGQCEFTNINYDLARGVYELVNSLGIGARISEFINSHDTRSWAVKFTPDFAPFRLSRKIKRCVLARSRKYHYIVSCEPVEPRRTVCIEVDSPSHLFLAGRSLVATHNSILRNAYRPWFYKKEIERIEAVGVERDLAGLPVMYVPPAVLDEGNSEYDAVRKRYQQIVENVRRDEQSGLLLPAEYDEQNNQTVKFELLSTGGTRTFDTNQVINRYAKSIATTVLADVVLLGHEKVGSFALADSKTKLFATGMAGWLKQIEAVLNRFAIPRLMRVNGFNPEEPPRFVAGDLEKEDVEQFTSAIERVTMAGWVTPGSVEDENHVRDLLSLPQVDDSGFDARNPMDIDTEDRPEAMQDGDRKDQEAALNGAQVTAMVQVVSDVANGLLPRDSGVQIIANSFPISFEQAERIIGDAGRGFTPRITGTENDLPPDP